MNKIDFNKLKAPFKNVSWRIGNKSQDGTSALFLAYIGARDVFDRLNEVVGPENWQNKHEIIPNGSMKCSILINVNGQWISKEDGSGTRNTEVEKSAYSDAIKRAAVLWGIGRYLYDVKSPYIKLGKYPDFKSLPSESKRILLSVLNEAERGYYYNINDNKNELFIDMMDKLLACKDKEELNVIRETLNNHKKDNKFSSAEINILRKEIRVLEQRFTSF